MVLICSAKLDLVYELGVVISPAEMSHLFEDQDRSLSDQQSTDHGGRLFFFSRVLSESSSDHIF